MVAASILAYRPTYLIVSQSVLNAAARSVAGLQRSEHITDILAIFHWLRSPERIKFWTGSHCLPRYSRHCTSVSVWSAAPRCWHRIKTPSPVVDLLWTGHPSIVDCYCRWSLICCCWPQALEHSACICAVSSDVLTKNEDTFVVAILFRHYIVACLLVAPGSRWKFLLRSL